MDNLNKTIIFTFLTIAVIITGLFSSYNLLVTRGFSSKVYGTLGLKDYVKVVNEEEFIFTFDKFKTSNGNLVYTRTLDTEITNLSEYSVKFNGYNTTNLVATNNSLYADYNIAFENYQNKVICKSGCKISLSLREKSIVFVLSVSNYTSSNLWIDYLKENNIKINLVEKITLSPIEETIIEPRDIAPDEPINEDYIEEDYVIVMQYEKTENYVYTTYTVREEVTSSLPYNNGKLSIVKFDNEFRTQSDYRLFFKVNNDLYEFKKSKVEVDDLTNESYFMNKVDSNSYDLRYYITEEKYIIVKIREEEILLYLYNIQNFKDFTICYF